VNQERRQEVRERTREILESLSTPERNLLTQILRIEHANVHLKKPRLKDDMLRAVRETIK
jgi:hypothetical protein